MSATREAMLRLKPGLTLPTDCTVRRAWYDFERDASWVVLSAWYLPPRADGCVPYAYDDLRQLVLSCWSAVEKHPDNPHDYFLRPKEPA